MPKTVTLVEFPELLYAAQQIGYTWNGAHEILVRDEIPPMYELNSIEYSLSELDDEDYSWSEDSRKILRHFYEVHGLTEFTLVRS